MPNEEIIKKEEYGIFTICNGNSQEWAATNPILENGELGYDTTTRRLKIGNGVLRWSELSCTISDIDISLITSSAVKLSDKLTISNADNVQDALVDIVSELKNIKDTTPTLNESGQIKPENLPSYVEDVIEVPEYINLPQPGERGKIYVTVADNKTYRWSGTAYIQIPKNVDIVQETGTSIDAVMSQKAVTDALENNTPIATTDIAGKVKPDGTSITVDFDGTIHSNTIGKERWMAYGTIESNTPPDDLAVGGTFYKLFVPPPKYDKTKIYGVDLVGRENPKNLPRINDSIGMSYQLVDNNNGTQGYLSDFDRVYPYGEMKRVVDKSGNVFIEIPKFYHKYTTNADGTIKVQISGTKYDGFTTLFTNAGTEIDYVRVGAYEGHSEKHKLVSKSGTTITTRNSFTDYRTMAMENGKGYCQYDFKIWQIIILLFTVEFATTDTRAIMHGYSYVSGQPLTNGLLDAIPQVTGCNGKVSDATKNIKYRGIENIYGGCDVFCDGVTYDSLSVYVCDDIIKYQTAVITVDYKKIGDIPYGGYYLTKIAPDSTGTYWLPKETSSQDWTRKNFYHTTYNDGRTYPMACLWVGSRTGDDSIWWHKPYTNSFVQWSLASRLCYKPIA